MKERNGRGTQPKDSTGGPAVPERKWSHPKVVPSNHVRDPPETRSSISPCPDGCRGLLLTRTREEGEYRTVPTIEWMGFAAELVVLIGGLIAIAVRMGKRFEDMQASVEQRFEDMQASVEQRFEDTKTSVEQRFEDTKTSVEQRFENTKTSVEQRFETMDARFNAVDKRFDDMHRSMDRRFGEVRADMEAMRSQITELRTEVRSEIGDVRSEIAELRTEMRSEIGLGAHREPGRPHGDRPEHP